MRVVVEATAEDEFQGPPKVLEAKLRKAFEVTAREIGCEVPCGAHFYKAVARDPKGGELDVVSELSERMVRAYNQRMRRMLADLKALEDGPEG